MEKGIIQVKEKKDLLWLAIFEFIGTAIFLLGINFSGGVSQIVAMSIFVAAILTGRVGGAHFNAGVTTAVYIIEGKWRKNLPTAAVIILADILGAYAGIGIAVLLQGRTDTFILRPKDDTESLAHVFFEEMMFSTIFIAVILSTKYDRTSTSKDGVLATLTVAITLNGLVGMSGAEEGGCFNPTIGFCVPTFQLIFSRSQEDPYFKYILVYVLGPLCGALIAALFTKFIALKIYTTTEEDEIERRRSIQNDIMSQRQSMIENMDPQYLLGGQTAGKGDTKQD